MQASPFKTVDDFADEPEERRSRFLAIRDARDELIFDLCEGAIDIAAALFNVSSKEIRRPGRGDPGICRVRQIAMYVAHVSLGMSMNDVGRGFARDRTTVLYACHLVEDLREDLDFDGMVQTAERIVVAVLGNRKAA